MTEERKSSPPKLGSGEDPIRQGLFACQPLKELLSRVRLDGRAGPFQTLADAARAIDEGRPDDARANLERVLETPQLETRIQLWTWSALRDLGVQPEVRAGTEVLGVVMEAAMTGGFDTLAAYQDGTARYLNFSGKAIFWDRPDVTIRELCQKLLGAAAADGARAKPRTSVALPRFGMQATLLTRSGMFAIPSPAQGIVGPAQRLMMELIGRAKAAGN